MSKSSKGDAGQQLPDWVLHLLETQAAAQAAEFSKVVDQKLAHLSRKAETETPATKKPKRDRDPSHRLGHLIP